MWWVSRWPVALERVHLGWLISSRYVIVTHRGRRSGRTFRTAVMVLRRDDASGEILVAAGSRDADWYRNIQAAPPMSVKCGHRRYSSAPRFLSSDELAEAIAWSRRHHRRNARVQALFFHWRWTDDRQALYALAETLAGVGFRPAPGGAPAASAHEAS